MAKLNIAPTKSNLLHIKEQLAVAEDGYELLEQKREILVMELMHLVEKVKLLEQKINKKVKEAYPELKKMLMTVGGDRVERISKAIHYDFLITEKTQVIGGMTFNSIDVELPKKQLFYSYTDSFANTDKVMARADSAEYPAFVWCRNKGKDWYLPAIEELRLLLCNKSVYGTVNKTLESRGAAELRNRGYKSHWSSTEFINEEPEYLAWVVWMYGGPTNALVKSRQCNVRAVSAF